MTLGSRPPTAPGVFDVERLVGNLCTVWIGRHRIHANAARFHRPKGSTSSHQPAMKGKIRDSSIGNTKDNGHRDDVKEVGVLENLKVALGNEGFTDIDLRYMGGLWVMIAFDSVEANEKFLLSTRVCSWFSQLIQASSEFTTDERVTMVEIEGKTHWVRAIQIPGWTPNLDDQNDEESDSKDEECEVVFKKDFNESDGSLGWSNLEFLNKRRVGTYSYVRGAEGSRTQMYYEFGIFSTIYGGKVMPTWITRRRKGPSISFTIPSSPNKLRGLNLSYVQTLIRPYWRSKVQYENSEYPFHQLIDLPHIKIRNMTKNLTWLYGHYLDRVNVGGKSLTFLSHWMFGENEMEDGDQLTISVKYDDDDDQPTEYIVRECGVSFVYDDGKNEKEEDPLSYYKSWNHIIVKKTVDVASKLSQENLTWSFRRAPRSGVEQDHLTDLTTYVEGVVLGVTPDRWYWMLDGSGEFSVASARKVIDDIG
ncbi:hypothetical protein Tco_0586936, partial [Tanacetum coccineum]